MRSKALLVTSLLLLSFPAAGLAANRYPSPPVGAVAASKWCNVRDFGVRGDGETDDTRAITDLIARFRPLGEFAPGYTSYRGLLLYFPAGTYLVTDTIAHGPPWMHRSIYGDGPDKTIIKLKDKAQGFGDPDAPKPVLLYHPKFRTPKKVDAANGYYNSLYDLTVDVGEGNPGAIAVAYHGNRMGALENLVFRAGGREKAGHSGLALMATWPGPCLVSNLTVDGFRHGVYSDVTRYSVTFRDLTLKNQLRWGIYNEGQSMFIDGLKIDCKVPGIYNGGFMVLVDADFKGASGEVGVENRGGMFARNVKSTGYRRAIDNIQSGHLSFALDTFGKREVEVPEFVSHKALSQFGGRLRSLNLASARPPEIPWDDPKTWASVKAFGRGKPIVMKYANRKRRVVDWTDAIQKAIDSGATTVYFPRDVYYFAGGNRSVIIRGKVRRIIGMESHFANVLTGIPESDIAKAPPMFVIEDLDHPLVIERLWYSASMWPEKRCVANRSSNDVILRHFYPRGGYVYVGPGKGRLFLEDVGGSPWSFNGQSVYAWQVAASGHGKHLVNAGGVLRVVGLTTQENGMGILTSKGGLSELLGGFVYGSGNTLERPFVSVDNSSFSGSWRHAGRAYAECARETRRGITTSLPQKDLRGSRDCPLFVGYEEGAREKR